MSYQLGDHLVTPRFGYVHHGLYAGSAMVLEYSQNGVNLVPVHDFAEGHRVSVKEHLTRRYSRAESVDRGYSRLGENSYNLVFNNCERFVYWCIDGVPVCGQIEGRMVDGLAVTALSSATGVGGAIGGIGAAAGIGTGITGTLMGVGATAASMTAAGPIAVGVGVGLAVGYGAKKLIHWIKD